jgi:hypothetical protein
MKIFSADTEDEEFVMAFLRTANLEHVIADFNLIPVEEYGSEGLMPLKGRCPEYPDTDISCMSGSGGSACGCFMGTADNFGLTVICNGGNK